MRSWSLYLDPAISLSSLWLSGISLASHCRRTGISQGGILATCSSHARRFSRHLFQVSLSDPDVCTECPVFGEQHFIPARRCVHPANACVACSLDAHLSGGVHPRAAPGHIGTLQSCRITSGHTQAPHSHRLSSRSLPPASSRPRLSHRCINSTSASTGITIAYVVGALVGIALLLALYRSVPNNGTR